MKKNENPLKFNWKVILNAIVQAAITALTALGVTGCSPFLRDFL